MSAFAKKTRGQSVDDESTDFPFSRLSTDLGLRKKLDKAIMRGFRQRIRSERLNRYRLRSTSFSSTQSDTGRLSGSRRMFVTGTTSNRRRSNCSENRAFGHRPRSNSLNTVYPIGNASDPLNLKGDAKDLPELVDSPTLKPKRSDGPVALLVPYNEKDPLGLMQDDETKPPCHEAYIRRRRRGRPKKKENVAAEKSETKVQSKAEEKLDPQNESADDSSNSVTASGAKAVETSVPSKSAVDELVVTEISMTSEEGVPVAEISSKDSLQSTEQLRAANASKIEIDSVDTVNSVPEVSDMKTKAVQNSKCEVAQVTVSQTESIDDGKTDSDNKGKNKGKGKMQRKATRTEVLKMESEAILPGQNLDLCTYPQNRKSLLRALRISPYSEEEKERIIKTQEKQNRDFIRMWKNPNLKSPEVNESSKVRSKSPPKELKIETSTSAERMQISPTKDRASRTVHSIVSPVMLQTERSQIRKRRRTVSDCSHTSSTAKALHFRRSSSPDVSLASTKKVRRLTFGSGNRSKKAEPEPVTFSKNPVFKHGNYYAYYGYRIPDMAPDPRLDFFHLEWFEGKDVLDIGCNAGLLTLAVAQCFHPQKIVGMDIDPRLIRLARQNIKRYQNMDNQKIMKRFPVSTAELGAIEPLPALTNPSNIFPKNIMFMQGDYVLERDEQLDFVKEEYDTILALSITKWIHLNSGDAGLKRAFRRMHRQLRPGGRLILEPQAWVSYRRRKKLTETIYINYNNIALKPDNFKNYLINKVGFFKCEFLGAPFNNSKGFQRPLLMFTKFGKQASPPRTVLEKPHPLHSIRERMENLAGYTIRPESRGPGGNMYAGDESPFSHFGTPSHGSPSFGRSPHSSGMRHPGFYRLGGDFDGASHYDPGLDFPRSPRFGGGFHTFSSEPDLHRFHLGRRFDSRLVRPGPDYDTCRGASATATSQSLGSATVGASSHQDGSVAMPDIPQDNELALPAAAAAAVGDVNVQQPMQEAVAEQQGNGMPEGEVVWQQIPNQQGPIEPEEMDVHQIPEIVQNGFLDHGEINGEHNGEHDHGENNGGLFVVGGLSPEAANDEQSSSPNLPPLVNGIDSSDSS